MNTKLVVALIAGLVVHAASAHVNLDITCQMNDTTVPVLWNAPCKLENGMTVSVKSIQEEDDCIVVSMIVMDGETVVSEPEMRVKMNDMGTAEIKMLGEENNLMTLTVRATK